MVKHNHRNPIHKLFIIFGTSVLVDKLCGAFIGERLFKHWALKVSFQDMDGSIC